MTNLFEEFILKIISSQFKRFNLAVGKGSIVWEGYWMQNNAKSTLLKSLCLVWPNGWMDEDAGWYGSIPGPRPRARRGSSSRERGTAATLFSAHVYCGHGTSLISAIAELSCCYTGIYGVSCLN